jgi:hypothetical protein
MRMPIFSYFLIVGSVLTGLLLWFGNESQPIETALTSSQMVGIPKRKPEPELEHARATAVNFGAEYKHPETRPVVTADTPPKRKTTINSLVPLKRNRFAGFPHDNLSIH